MTEPLLSLIAAGVAIIAGNTSTGSAWVYFYAAAMLLMIDDNYTSP